MAAGRCLKMVFMWTEILTLILLGYRFCCGAELPLRAHCDVARMEITYPRVVDIKGEQSRSWTVGAPLPGSVRILFTWRSRQRLLRLFRNDVAAKEMVVVYNDNSHNDTVAEIGRGDNCFYVGFLKKEHASYAAVSTCLGLAGYIQTDDELLFIAPAGPRKEEVKLWGQWPHVIYTCSTSEGSTGISNGGNASMVGEKQAEPQRSPVGPRRRKRAAGDKKKYLEVMLAVDHTVTAMHGKDRIKNYVMTLMNIANSVYQHHTLGVNIRVVVTEIVLLEKDDQRRVLTKKDAYRTVQQFCQWTMHRLSPRYSAKHDVSVLLTRESLGPAGYAPITGLCDPSRSCAAVTDEGFTTGFIIAHETAHIFGLFHDGHGNTCTGRRYTTSVMAPLVEAKLNHYWWSECSKQRMQEVINYLYCLNDEPDMVSGTTTHYELDSGSTLHDEIGKDYTLQFQCRLEFGNEFILCAAFEMDACNMLWCSERSSPHMCRTKRGPPLPGSNCGHQRQCRNNQCAYVGNEKPVHGNWSNWEEWGACNGDCGVGIRRRRRSCTNPQPAYGGRECDGSSEDWDTCLNKDCSQYQDSREAHCSVWNDLNVRSGHHDWLPYQSSKESDQCKQTCVSNRTGEVVTIDIEISDGTPCTYEDPTNICYLGSCLKVGCDGVRNSTKEYDSCGVCGGSNSECKTVSGHFKRTPSTKDDYETIVLLPKGSRNIEVTKRGVNKHFLALRDPRYGTFPLNGDKKRGNSRDVIIGGARFVYKSVNFIQTIKSSGPLYFEMEVMLYPNKDNSEVSVTYEYTVNRKDMTLERRKYQWRFYNWTQCSVTCGDGVMHTEHACWDKDSGLEVSKDKCEFLDPPRRDEAPCNAGSCTMTRYTWAMTNDWSACNVSECGGHGVETQGYKCELHYLNNDTYEKADMDLCDPSAAPIVTQPCTGPPCNLKWTAGSWSECSVTCGKGRQSRTVYCGDPATDADDMWCKDKPPHSSRPCEKKACEQTISDDACSDKYTFCSRAVSLNVKCQSDRFRQICCKACRDVESAATRPQLSQWTLYRQRMLRAKSK